MSRARDFADLAGSADAGGLTGRNLIINGAMQVAQRGTSETGITSSEYANAPDRFKAQITTAGTWTLSQSSTAPDGFANSYKWDCTTADASLAAGDVIQFAHKVEAQNLQQLQYGTSGAQAVTVSFYVRSNKTGTYILEIYQDDGARGISKSYTIDSADTWERKTITIPGDSSGSINDDNGIGFDMLWYLAAGTNFTSGTLATDWASLTSANRAVGQVNLADSTSNEWYITGIQLEVGEQATPFEHRSYGDTLLQCQRFFYRISGYRQGAYSPCMIAYATSAAQGTLQLPTHMRAAPSLSLSGAGFKLEDGGAGYTSTSTSFAGTVTDVGHINYWIGGLSGLVDGNAYYAYGNSSSHYLDIDAEL